jgi:hypothetical protein
VAGTSIKHRHEGEVVYGGRTYTYRGDIRWTIQNEKKFVVVIPPDLDDEPAKSATQKRIWE